MPEIGETRYNTHSQKQIWHACIDCGKGRWVVLYGGNPEHERCQKCANTQRNLKGERNPAWRGGISHDHSGYILIKLLPDDPFISMASQNRYVREHRLVMAKHLGRPLDRNEWVHHKNGNKQGNHIENLALVANQRHPLSFGEAYKDGYLQGYADAQKGLKPEGSLSL